MSQTPFQDIVRPSLTYKVVHKQHERDARQEIPVELLENLLVEQCHVDFAFSDEQRVAIENLVGGHNASRFLDMLNSVKVFLDGRALLLLCRKALAVVCHSVVEFGVESSLMKSQRGDETV